ncbi:NAD-dependent epimerase/dehydratase family protein [Legionella sp. CNM-4043-24]|uniref:NAD-dependent epimerase/dehydratase family protein n=1 Tax=Legionella sp. CNM-4043-24 TaxID=3421646 RepID=UPI00403B0165
MNHVIMGYGYCGFHLAAYLRQQHQTVITLSRHLDESLRLPDVTHLVQDALKPLPEDYPGCVLYYLIPPPQEGREDTLLRQFLANTNIKPSRMVYFGSSAVYGSQHGQWVDEQTPCHPETDRQFRRLDAESQWQAYGQRHGIETMVLRVAGIYGPNRLPIEGARQQMPLINPDEAPFTNHIYVHDLVKVAARLSAAGVYNVADGQPMPMGSLQQQVALTLGFPAAATQSFAQALREASPMKREFMQSSKRLMIKALQQALTDFQPTPLASAIKDSL